MPPPVFLEFGANWRHFCFRLRRFRFTFRLCTRCWHGGNGGPCRPLLSQFLADGVQRGSHGFRNDPSIELLKDEVCVMSPLAQINPVKRGDPSIQLEKATRPTIQPDPAQELSLGIQQTRHETRELCVSRCRSHLRSL